MSCKPTFIGIGVQKCASTWVYRILEDHPDIMVSETKEVDFFSYHFHFGFAWYEHFFSQGIAVGENSPSYFCDERAPKRVCDYQPNMKVIVCLRDPVARIKSHHAHEVRLGHIHAEVSYTEALHNNPMYVEQSEYAKHLTHWFKYFSKENVLVLTQEHIQEKPRQIAQQVYHFLGVDEVFESSFVRKKANVSQQPRFAWLSAGLKGLAKVARKIGLSMLVMKIKNHRVVSGLMQKNMLNIHLALPEMTAAEQQSIDDALKEDLLALQTLVDIDLQSWSSYRRLKKSLQLGEAGE